MRWLCLLLLGVLMVACAPKPDSTAGKIVIGILVYVDADHPGREEALWGAVVAAETGFAGEPIELVTETTARTHADAEAAVQRLVQAGAQAIVVDHDPRILEAAIEEARLAGPIPVLSLVPITPGGHIFELLDPGGAVGIALADYANRVLERREVGIMTDLLSKRALAVSEAFRTRFESLGGTVVDEQFYDFRSTNFEGQINQLRLRRPTAILVTGPLPKSAAFVRFARGSALRSALFLSHEMWDSPTRHTLENPPENVVYATLFLPEGQAGEALDQAVRARTGRPATYAAALGYDAVRFAAEAIVATRASKAEDSITVMDALRRPEGYTGLTGRVNFVTGTRDVRIVE